jgi:hypothetical protein
VERQCHVFSEHLGGCERLTGLCQLMGETAPRLVFKGSARIRNIESPQQCRNRCGGREAVAADHFDEDDNTICMRSASGIRRITHPHTQLCRPRQCPPLHQLQYTHAKEFGGITRTEPVIQ